MFSSDAATIDILCDRYHIRFTFLVKFDKTIRANKVLRIIAFVVFNIIYVHSLYYILVYSYREEKKNAFGLQI